MSAIGNGVRTTRAEWRSVGGAKLLPIGSRSNVLDGCIAAR